MILPTPKVTHISFHSFTGKLTKCWFSYSLVLISLRYLDDRNMSMRNLFFHLHSAMLKQLLMHFADSFLTLIPLLYFLRDPKQALFSAASITHQGHHMQTGIAEDQQHNLASHPGCWMPLESKYLQLWRNCRGK